ncbi:MAG: type II secretion system F family protein [Phycisphaerae bacterium]
MPLYQYQAMNSAGQEVKSEIEAMTSDDAVAKIRAQGYFVSKIKEREAKKGKGGAPAAGGTAPAKKASMSIAFGGVSAKDVTTFTRQLSTLQDAGLPILRSLKILSEQQKPGLLKTVLEGVSADVEGGSTLSESMSRQPKAFDRLYVNMVQAGETGGVLDVILQRLAEFMEKSQRLKRKVIGAMIYPCAVISFALLILIGIMMFVVPNFKKIFSDFRTDLPILTDYLIKASEWIANQYGWAYLLATPIILGTAFKIVHKTAGGKALFDRLVLKVPIFGDILEKTTIARFSRTLGTLLSSGVPILDAIIITKETCGNTVFMNALQKVHDGIREGESFAAPLRAEKVCDSLVTNMIDVGEETGDLDKMLVKIADNYDEEVDIKIGSMMSLLEPVMIIFLGGMVGTIVIALFLPMVKLIESVSGK